MTFQNRLDAARLMVEAELSQKLAVDTNVPARLRAAMQEAVLGGGKRFRPFLVIESARLFGANSTAAITVATALEAIHCYSLVHDDLPSMDDDEFRRGRPTVWKAFDEWTAILAGDALLTLAFEWLADANSAIPPAAVPKLVSELARAAGPSGMVGGQIIDLEADKLGQPPQPTVNHIRRLQQMKTGALIRFACRAGPLLAGSTSEHLEALTLYGEKLGLAFQISDDLLDATGDAVETGKAVAKDAAAGKATMVGLYGPEGARTLLADTQSQARAVLACYGPKSAALIEAVDFMAVRRS